MIHDGNDLNSHFTCLDQVDQTLCALCLRRSAWRGARDDHDGVAQARQGMDLERGSTSA